MRSGFQPGEQIPPPLVRLPKRTVGLIYLHQARQDVSVIAVSAQDQQIIELRARSESRGHVVRRLRIRLLDGEAVHQDGQAHGRDVAERDVDARGAGSLPATA
ncbi:hypothetical protein GCM10020001_108580 [Nonomuraea salmonea]